MSDVEPPKGFAPWCSTLRGEQAWRLDVPTDDALPTWRGLRDRHSRTRLWPVLLGADDRVVDQLTWRLDLMARDRPGIPEEVPSPDELLVDWLGDVADDDFLADVPRHLEDARSAFELAVQHYAYCPALMDHLAPAIGTLAATMFGRHWLFDWS